MYYYEIKGLFLIITFIIMKKVGEDQCYNLFCVVDPLIMRVIEA